MKDVIFWMGLLMMAVGLVWDLFSVYVSYRAPVAADAATHTVAKDGGLTFHPWHVVCVAIFFVGTVMMCATTERFKGIQSLVDKMDSWSSSAPAPAPTPTSGTKKAQIPLPEDVKYDANTGKVSMKDPPSPGFELCVYWDGGSVKPPSAGGTYFGSQKEVFVSKGASNVRVLFAKADGSEATSLVDAK